MLSRQTNKPYVIARGGACAYAPENTLAAASLAYQCHSDMWELNVSLSKDGHPVVIRDDTLLRTTNVLQRPEFSSRDSFRVCDFTLAELKSLDAGSWYAQKDPFQQAAQKKIDAATLKSYSDITIPTLEEALIFTSAKNWLVNVEIKDCANICGHEQIVSTVLDRIQKIDMVEQTLLSSFRTEYLIEARKKLPELATAVLTDEAPKNPLELCKTLGAQFYHPNLNNLGRQNLKPLLEEGVGVNVWTAYARADFQELFKRGASGVITPFPERFRQYAIETLSHTARFA